MKRRKIIGPTKSSITGKENLCSRRKASVENGTVSTDAFKCPEDNVSKKRVTLAGPKCGSSNVSSSVSNKNVSVKKTPFHVHCDKAEEKHALRASRNDLKPLEERQNEPIITNSNHNNVITPVDAVPLIPLIPIKKEQHAKREVKREISEKVPDNQQFPPELAYHLQYFHDTLAVEQEREDRSPKLSENFLRRNINIEQRKIIISFLIRLTSHCNYPSFIVYQSIKLFDIAMDRIPMQTIDMQLTALACLWIGLKREENFHKIPSGSTIIAFARELYEGRLDLLVERERRILAALDFNISFVDPFSLFAYYLISCKRAVDIPDIKISSIYYCGGYVIDLTLLDEEFCCVSPHLLIVVVTELILCIVLDFERDSPRWSFWRKVISESSSRKFHEDEIRPLRTIMLRHILSSNEKNSCFMVIYKKYKRGRYGRISDFLINRTNKILDDM